MPHLDEALARLAADALRGRIRSDQLGIVGLELLKFLHQLVEFEVADLGIIENVVKMFVATDLLAKSFNLCFWVFSSRRHRQRL